MEAARGPSVILTGNSAENSAGNSEGSDSVGRLNQRKRAYRNEGAMAVLSVSAVIVCMAVIVNLKVSALEEKDKTYSSRLGVLEQELQSEQDRAQELEKNRLYVQTKQYIEEVAKEKLGLVNPDEIILKPNKK